MSFRSPVPVFPRAALLACAALAAVPAWAAPPPGHPSPAVARELLLPEQPPRAGDLPREGKVLSSIDANEYTYIEVSRGGATEWLAAPRMPLKAGSSIRYEDGSVMTNFYSKLLRRTFPSVTFVGQVVVTGTP